jgi:carboxymethylenebutenolidase
MMHELIIPAAEGHTRGFYFTPDKDGEWPSVLMYMDGIGIRPAMLAVGERLAQHGFAVLMPDLFYRAGAYRPMNAKTIFATPRSRNRLFSRFFANATPEMVMADTKYYLKTLKNLPGVKPQSKVAVVGYCMGGKMALTAAGVFGSKIALAASFHGGGLVNETKLSPHRLARKMKAKIYVGGAIEDASFTDDDKKVLKAAFKQYDVKHKIETYEAKHGWVITDHLAYNRAAAEKHWKILPRLIKNI